MRKLILLAKRFHALRQTPPVDDDFPEMMHNADSALRAILQDNYGHDFPQTICLCGSTKFKHEFEQMEKSFTIGGNIVLTVGFFGHMEDEIIPSEVKESLDKLHLEKIRVSDLVFIINKDGYIGESTKNEIEFAKSLGKQVVYMEKP